MPAKKAAADEKRRRNRAPAPSRVDNQGRTIIPATIRDELGLGDEGGHVIYEKVDGRMTIRKVKVDWK